MVKGDWKFDDGVAGQFEDMMDHSIPCYRIVQEMFLDMAEWFIGKHPDNMIVDIGASPGITMESFVNKYSWVKYHALDSSDAMIQKLIKKAEKYENKTFIDVSKYDANGPLEFGNSSASLIIASCIMMFVKPENRLNLYRDCYRVLRPGKAMFVFNKIKGDGIFEEKWIDLYHKFKFNFYTKEEIEKKAESLDGVLVPCTIKQDMQNMELAGFSHIGIFFKWYNFCGYLAVK